MRERGKEKPRILVFLSHFLPGEKGGGPVQSIAGLLEALGEEFDFRVVTSDHDLGERDPMPGVEPDVWQNRYGSSICYLSMAGTPVRHIVEILRKGEFDLIYLNSFFSRYYSMLPAILWRLGLIRQVPLILAPRGEFGHGALALKRIRKAVYLRLARRLSLYRGVYWQASSTVEEKEILEVLRRHEASPALPTRGKDSKVRDEGNKARLVIRVALDLARRVDSNLKSWPAKKAGALSVAFLSRVTPKKNLDGALRMLHGLKGDVKFTIFGPQEDKRYWNQCELLMKSLNHNVQVRYGGVLAHADVPEVLQAADLFFFPTHNENFGHVIAEALLAGCPALTSDQTPWRGLEAEHAGWDLSLNEPARFTEILQECVDMGAEDFRELRLGARNRGLRYLKEETGVVQHRKLFRAALSQSPPDGSDS